MRTKFLAIIVSFLMMSVAMSSCLESETYEYSADATVYAFGIDSIHGKYYTFTIDQLSRVIYNRDSLPMDADTILDRILIDTMTVTGWITSADTVVSISDSMDLRPAVNNATGMKFKIFAADGVTNREYTLKINMHLQDPDSLVWKNMDEEAEIFSATPIAGEQRSVILGNELLLFTSNTTLYKTSIEPYQYGWSKQTVSGLPENVKLASVLHSQEKLYMLTETGEVYISADGMTWNQATELGNQVVALLASIGQNELNGTENSVAAIVKGDDGADYFCVTTDDVTWEQGNAVPAGFPTENIYYTNQLNANGIEKVYLVGMPQANSTKTIPWFTLDGKEWADLATNTLAYCPGLTNPSMMYYGGLF